MILHFLSAIQLFRAQKLRFLLTVSGIVVGVGSMLLLASLLSVGRSVLEQQSFEATGDDVISVQNDWNALQEDPDAHRLRARDLENLENSALLQNEEISANYGMRRGVTAVFDGEEWNPMMTGVGPTAFSVYRLEIEKGRLFTEEEYQSQRKVIIVGGNVHHGQMQPGDQIRLSGTPYTVVGVMANKPEMGPGGSWSWNNRIILPDSTFNLNFNASRRPNSIVVRVDPPESYKQPVKDYALATRDVIDMILMKQHDGSRGWMFEGVEADDSTGAIITTVIELLIYLTTIFSMVVGGINIMNIMLVTVAERTREIGLRRALGATQGDILRQFLAETVAVTWIGAFLGALGATVLLGIAAAAITHWVVEWPFHVEPWAFFLSIAFATVIGLLFGMYPAWRASRLDPVEALRTD